MPRKPMPCLLPLFLFALPSASARTCPLITKSGCPNPILHVGGEPVFCSIRRRSEGLSVLGISGTRLFGSLIGFIKLVAPFGRFFLLYLPGGKLMKMDHLNSGQDANCGNTLLISLEELVKDGLLAKSELPDPIVSDRVNFSAVAELKDPLIAKRLILSDGELKSQLENFSKDPNVSSWLEDAAYFAAIDDSLNTLSWYDWPEPLKNRHLAALEDICQSKKDFLEIFIAQQFLFQWQWQKVRNYAQEKGISIMGDMPIYVGYHSADVWANKKHFLLNRNGFPLLVSGVPPDAFSTTGQLWGSPLYDWKAMEKDGYSWRICRMQRARDLYDEFRIDHFRGFAGYWAVPSDAKVAIDGNWKAGPGKSLFDAISRATGKISIIAEDLGVITEDVVLLRKSIGAPGMAVLQFGFVSDANNPHLPHNHEVNQIVYTGTHDNDTVKLFAVGGMFWSPGRSQIYSSFSQLLKKMISHGCSSKPCFHQWPKLQ